MVRDQCDGDGNELWGGVRDEAGCLRVLQLTDIHLFGDSRSRLVGVDTEASFADVMDGVLSRCWPVDLILLTGDIVHDGSEGGYRRLKCQFEDLAVRTLVIPGNHDDPEVMRRVFSKGRVTCSGNAVLGNWQFVMLDSCVPGQAGGRLSERQLGLLERYLAAHPDSHALVCVHHHPVPMGSRWMDRIGIENADQFLAVLDRHDNVRGVLWGHVHQRFEQQRGGVRLMSTPSTSVQFRPGSDEFEVDAAAPGYRWLKLYPDGRIVSEVQRLDARRQGLDLECSGYR